MMKKKIIALIIAAAALSCSGCASASEETVQRYAWPLGTSSPEDTVTQIYAENFAEEVSALSNGRMKIQVYPNSVLGGDRELLESCKDGDIPFVVQNTAPQVTFMPDIAVFDMPCVYGNIEDIRTAIDDESFINKISAVYRDAGYELLGYADQGFRVMSTNREVRAIGDFKGQKIRTMENSYHLAFWKEIGANPTPMTFSEVYIGLQQGTIDAQENPYEVIVSNKLYEQQDYVIETNHLPHLISLIVSDEFMQGLPEEDREIIREAAAKAKEFAREQSDERIASRVQIIEDSGTKIITPDDDLRAEIKEKCRPVYDEIKANIDPELAEAYLAGAK